LTVTLKVTVNYSQPILILRNLDHRRAFAFGDLFDVKEEAFLFVADHLHGFVDVLQHALSVPAFQFADDRLNDGEGHFAQRIQRLVVMHALL